MRRTLRWLTYTSQYFKVTKIKQHRGFIDHTKGTTYDDGAIELGSSNSGSDVCLANSIVLLHKLPGLTALVLQEDLVALPGTAQGIVELAQQLSGKVSTLDQNRSYSDN